MNTADILEVPPLEMVERVARSAGLTVRDLMRALRALTSEQDTLPLIEWQYAEWVRNSNHRIKKTEQTESARRRARSETL